MQTKKVLIFDSSTIINFALNGILHILEELKKIFDGKFIVPRQVKKEIIDRPLQTKRFELEALQIRNLFEKEILQLPEKIGIGKEILLILKKN